MATTDKYDRQLRLWGASGQRSLAETCIVLIRATAAGTETLKNLVLPGIGAFCIVDDVHMTTMSSNNNAPNTEFTSNFFLTAAVDGDNTTMSRAQMATEYLQELNSDVKGSYHDISSSSSMDGAALLQFVLSTSSSSSNSGSIDSLVSLIQDQILINSSSETMKIKSILVVASDLEPNLLLATSRTCDKNAWPLLAVHSYGLMGIVRCQVSESCLLPLFHTKRSSPPDLRLAALCATPSQQEHQQQQQQQQQQQPSPLQLHMQEMYNTVGDWDQMTSQQHGHVPYPLILMKIQRQWLASNATLPSSFAEKQAFQAMVQQSARDFGNELNFQEAHRNAYLAYNVDGGGGNVDTSHLQFLIKILKEALGLDTESLNSGNSSGISFDDGPGEQQQQQKTQLQFLIMLEALQEFLTLHHGQAPLQGTIPDMTASTDLYVQLQNIYRNQAQRDLQEMRRLCVAKQQQLQQLQQQRNMAAAAAAGIPAIVTVVSDDRDVAEAAAAVNSNSNISSIVADEDLSTFCQNVQFLDIFQTRTLIQEYNVIDEDDEYKNNNNINIKDVSGYDDDFEDICQDLSMACLEVAGNDDDDDEDGDENNCSASDERPDMFPLFWYLGFRACQLFHQRHGRYPGTIADSDDKKYLQDIPLLQACLEKAVQAYQLQDLPVVKKVLLTDAEYKVVTELTRYAQAEIHTIASVVGGVASQEAVKLITGQYVPLHHTYVYNGIASTGGVYKF